MGFLRRREPTAEPDLPPTGLAMTIQDTFWIGARTDAKLSSAQRAAARQAPGTVLAGEVVGTGTLKPGDFAVHEAGRFQIVRIKAFRENVERVQPPHNVGLVLGTDVDRDLFSEGQQLRFERDPTKDG